MAWMGADVFGYTADLRTDRSIAQLLRLRRREQRSAGKATTWRSTAALCSSG
jgi:hypothetical protein